MTDEQKEVMTKIIVAISVLVLAILFQPQGVLKFAIYFIAYFIVGAEIVKDALKNLISGKIFDENFLMSIATLGAFAIQEYPEAVAVMILFQIGELFQSYAVEKSCKSITELMDIRPDYANIESDGRITKIPPEQVEIGDEITVMTGEKIPLDGVVTEGNALIDCKALTGESIPTEVKAGTSVLSGCINLNGVLKIKVTKPFSESTVAKILELVENAASKKARAEKFITKFARIYTPFVVILAVLITILPPLIIQDAQFEDWFKRALTFLVISCPCALVISIPLSFFSGIGGASRAGILIKGSNYLEFLASPQYVVFDKTGTLTKGAFDVTRIEPANAYNGYDLLKYAALAESFSSHPIAHSLKKAYGTEPENGEVYDVKEIAGRGVCAVVEGKKVLAGNEKLMDENNIKYERINVTGSVIYIAIDNIYAGYIVISDEIKNSALRTICDLKNYGAKIAMLTGDSKIVADKVAKELKICDVYSELLPAQKVEIVEKFINEKRPEKSVLFCGDGINDAPVLMRADVGIAMGALGSDAAIEAADVVIMDDDPSKIALGVKIARKTLTIVKENIAFAIGIKLLFLILGAMGLMTMWGAVFADVGVSVIAILNALRALKI